MSLEFRKVSVGDENVVILAYRYSVKAMRLVTSTTAILV